jgi:hypothetical protein
LEIIRCNSTEAVDLSTSKADRATSTCRTDPTTIQIHIIGTDLLNEDVEIGCEHYVLIVLHMASYDAFVQKPWLCTVLKVSPSTIFEGSVTGRHYRHYNNW